MSPTRANAEALGSLALMALAGVFVAVSAILFVPLAFGALALGIVALSGGASPLLLPVAAGLFLAAWNCALTTETLADPTPPSVAWLGMRTLALVGGAALALAGA